jgi:MarR family transcriptional regulator, transcriptional regulator for hemolysin
MERHGEDVRTDSLDSALAYRVYRAARVLRIHLIRFLEGLGVELSPEQYFVLLKVQANPGSSQSDLADQHFADYPNITRLIDSLVRRNLLVRQRVAGDRRRHAVFLTDEGRETTNRLLAAVAAERKAMYEGIPQNEIDSAVSVLLLLEERASQRAGLIPRKER